MWTCEFIFFKIMTLAKILHSLYWIYIFKWGFSSNNGDWYRARFWRLCQRHYPLYELQKIDHFKLDCFWKLKKKSFTKLLIYIFTPNFTFSEIRISAIAQLTSTESFKKRILKMAGKIFFFYCRQLFKLHIWLYAW